MENVSYLVKMTFIIFIQCDQHGKRYTGWESNGDKVKLKLISLIVVVTNNNNNMMIE